MEKVPSKQEQKDNTSLILWAQELATQETARQIKNIVISGFAKFEPDQHLIKSEILNQIEFKFLQEK